MSKPYQIAVVTASLLLVTSSASAHNNIYLPGDAFFATAWPAKPPRAAEASLTLTYSYLYPYLMACGYAGYWKLRIELNAGLRQQMRRAQRLIKRHGLRVWDGKLTTLVYNRTFDLHRHPLFVRFNEHASAVQVTVLKRSHVTATQSGNAHADAIGKQLSRRVAPLRLMRLPKPPPKGGIMGISDPLVARADHVNIVVVDRATVKQVAGRLSGLKLVVVNDYSARAYRYVGGKLVPLR